MKQTYILFLISVFLCLSCETAQKNKKEETAQELFDKAKKASQRGQYISAVEVISQLKYKHPYSSLSVQADLLRADIAYDQKEWKQAEGAYKLFMNLYPSHEKIKYAYFRHILSLNQQIPQVATRDLSNADKLLDAIKAFQQKFPKTEYSKQVQNIKTEIYNRKARKEFEIAQFYFKKRKYSASLGRLDQVIENYIDSTWYKPSLEMAQKIAKELKNDKLEQKYSKKKQS